jgi:hypothetical protein
MECRKCRSRVCEYNNVNWTSLFTICHTHPSCSGRVFILRARANDKRDRPATGEPPRFEGKSPVRKRQVTAGRAKPIGDMSTEPG